MSDNALRPLAPLDTAPLFAGLGGELLALLRSLSAEQWCWPTLCRAWQVRDIAAHLLDSGVRRISVDRDGHFAPPPAAPIASYQDLVVFLNRLNAEWVTAMRRVSPRALVDLLEVVERDLPGVFAALDPQARATFGVSWAGEDSSPVWFDVARELTERWHHQQQIRLAVGAPPLDDPRWSRPVLETFLRALPHRYREVSGAEGTALVLKIFGREEYPFTLRRDGMAWQLWHGTASSPSATVILSEEIAWRVLTHGIPAREARQRATLGGDVALVEPLFTTLAVMA